MPDENYRTAINDKFDLSKYNLFINHWPMKSATTMDLRAWATKIMTRYKVKPDIFMIDYDDCLLPIDVSVRGNMYEESGAVYNDMIQLASYLKCPVLTFAQPKRESWEIPDTGGLIYSHHLAHSALKVHKAWSISTINFPVGSNTGILYVDDNRRGESGVKIPIYKDLRRGLIKEKIGG